MVTLPTIANPHVPELRGQPLAATSDAGLPSSRLLYVTEHTTGLRFLVDTGAEVSVLPPSRIERTHRQDDFSLRAVNGTPIATYGTRSLTMDLRLRRTFRWIFVLADVQKPILGADFLHHCGLLVDLQRKRLVDAVTQLNIQGIITHDPSPSPSIPSNKPSNEFAALLSEVQHDVTRHIVTHGPPVFARTRRLAPERLKVARQEFQHMLELGIIQPSSSSWSSPLHLVPQKTPGDWRPCGDYSHSRSLPHSPYPRFCFLPPWRNHILQD